VPVFFILYSKVVLDVVRGKALREENPLHKLVILRSFHLFSCSGGCDSGDELDLKIAKASPGVAAQVKLKRYELQSSIEQVSLPFTS
jgi:hypothetical protein